MVARIADDGSVIHLHFDLILTAVEKSRDFYTVRRMPERSGALTIDKHDCGFSYWWIEQCVHAVYVWRSVVDSRRSHSEIKEEMRAWRRRIFDSDFLRIVGFAGEVLLVWNVGPRRQTAQRLTRCRSGKTNLPSATQVRE